MRKLVFTYGEFGNNKLRFLRLFLETFSGGSKKLLLLFSSYKQKFDMSTSLDNILSKKDFRHFFNIVPLLAYQILHNFVVITYFFNFGGG